MLKSIKQFFCGPPKPPRPAPKEMNVGQIKATIYFSDGETYKKLFTGFPMGWQYLNFVNAWVSRGVTANKLYEEFLEETKERGFIKVSDTKDYPISEITKIELTEEEFGAIVE